MIKWGKAKLTIWFVRYLTSNRILVKKGVSMAEVRAVFTISADSRLLGKIEKIMDAIGDAGINGLENHYVGEESKKLEIAADSVDLARVCGWIAIIQRVFNENSMDCFSIKAKGVTDNDYGYYTAFEIVCDKKEIKVREHDFDCELSEETEDSDLDDNLWEYEAKELNAFGELDKEKFRNIEKDDLYYEDDEYNVALEAF